MNIAEKRNIIDFSGSTLWDDYISYMLEKGYALNTARTTKGYVYTVWRNCGDEYLWELLSANEEKMRDILSTFIDTYYPLQTRYLNNYMSSFRYFQDYLTNGGRSRK